MRLFLCEQFLLFVKSLFSGGTVEDMADQSLSPPDRSLVRTCANIKSRKNPDVQCTLNATHGDFCSRHWKHPRRFFRAEWKERVYTLQDAQAARRLQAFWRRRSPWRQIQQQGLGFLSRDQCRNDTELYSLESIQSIPRLYVFSYLDTKANLWCFDIRSLAQILYVGSHKENPYTRESFSERTLDKIRSRLSWLRRRKYTIFYPSGVEMTQEQLWNQKILDLLMIVESFGYHVSSDWIKQMSVSDHKTFYTTFYNLWYTRLGLTTYERDSILPGQMTLLKRFFKVSPFHMHSVSQTKSWWERSTVGLIEVFLTKAADKERQKLCALYCMMAFVASNEDAAEAYPWIVATLTD